MSRARVSRRTFLVGAGVSGAALLLSFATGRLRRRAPRGRDGPADGFIPNLWLRIDRDGRVQVTVHKVEMGQGVLTALPMLVAEELGAEWSRVSVQQAECDFRFADQNTSSSSSIIDSWTPLRTAGAMARQMLLAAAAARWDVSLSECDAVEGQVVHAGSGRRLRFGELIEEAARVPPPDPGSVRLKPPGEFRLIGRATRRVDAAEIVTGRRTYGIDVRLPGMLYAAVARSSTIGGSIVSVDDSAARPMPGVRHIVRLPADPPTRLPERVAVIAETSWAALQGRRALRLEQRDGPHAALSSAAVRETLLAAERSPGMVVRNDGHVPPLAELPADAVRVRYELPYLAHAPMEPMNGTAQVRGREVEIWAPTQFPQRAVEHVSRVTDFSRDAIRLHVTPMGGGFGRRVYADFVVEAVQIAQAVGVPVKTVWTREDDIANDFFRPATMHHLAATLDRRGYPASWRHHLMGPSVVKDVSGGANLAVEANEIGGAVDVPYRIPGVHVEYHLADLPVPLGVWRSVAHSQTIFAVESFIDELAQRTGADPVAYRLALLDSHPRLARVLRRAAELAGWGSPLAAGRGRGVAVSGYERTVVAQVAEVTMRPDGVRRVDRVVCVVDCGQVVNPSGVEAQVEGGIIWGLSAALKSKVTLKDGRIEQSNFHDYQVFRISDAPRIEVDIIPSRDEPGGIGEPPVAGVAPAVANAVFAATGVRLRELPLGPARHVGSPPPVSP
ncbi:MAG: molybdopterin cofactor-binding domain-containing protein [Gemmatimonadales bacterium]